MLKMKPKNCLLLILSSLLLFQHTEAAGGGNGAKSERETSGVKNVAETQGVVKGPNVEDIATSGARAPEIEKVLEEPLEIESAPDSQQIRATTVENVEKSEVKDREVENIGKSQHLEASGVENVAESQVKDASVKHVAESQVKGASAKHVAESQVKEPKIGNVDESKVATPEVENVADSSQIEASNVESVDESQVATPEVENVADSSQIEASNVESVDESQVATSKVENVADSSQLVASNVDGIDESRVEAPSDENDDESKEPPPNVEDVALLQSYIEPENYNVYISIFNNGNKPHLKGRLKITIRCLVATNKVVLNAEDIVITEFQAGVSHVRKNRYTTPEIVKTRKVYFAGNRPDIFVLELEETLKAGVSYNVGVIITSDNNLEHFQRKEQLSYYYTKDWHDHEMIELFARISPNKARVIFPCFCERNVKSTFKVEIAHFANVVALSNWNVSEIQTKIGNFQDQTITIFKTSALMSPSGLSFAVTSSKSTDLLGPEPKESGPPIRIWADERLIRLMAEARRIARRVLKFYLDYFNLPLYAPKLDILAVRKFPNYKADTEKFGLITMEESSLLYYGDDVQKYFHITRDLCFAMSGQWFGSSVTMSDLKENYFHQGLSYFLETICSNEVNPRTGYNFYHIRNLITFNRTLMPDYETKLYSEFDSAFNHKLPTGDTQKALRLVRMLVFILSEQTLSDGLKVYLKESEKSFSNLENLWTILTNEARNNGISNADKLTVKEMMDTWVRTNEFPLLRVDVDYSGETATMTLSQEPFKLLGEEKEEGKKVCWNIFMSYVTRTGLKFLLSKNEPNWLTCEKSETFKVNLEPNEWIIVNSQLNVLSHTYFGGKNWELIQATLLNPETFSDIDDLTRVHLNLDMFALAAAGVVLYERLFHTMKYLTHETSALCWIVALTEFDKIYTYLLGTTPKLVRQFQNYVKDILDPVFNSVTNYEKYAELLQDSTLNKEPNQPAKMEEIPPVALETKYKTLSRPPVNTGETPQDLGLISEKLSNQAAIIGQTLHVYDVNVESEKIFNQPRSPDDIKPDDSWKENKNFRKLFAKPVKIDEILAREDDDKKQEGDTLKIEFIKLFVRSSCKFGVPECIKQSQTLYDNWIESIENKDPVIKE